MVGWLEQWWGDGNNDGVVGIMVGWWEQWLGGLLKRQTYRGMFMSLS